MQRINYELKNERLQNEKLQTEEMMLRMDKRKLEKERDKLSGMVSDQISARSHLDEEMLNSLAKSEPPVAHTQETPERQSRFERSFGTSAKKIKLKRSGVDLSASLASNDLQFDGGVIQKDAF